MQLRKIGLRNIKTALSVMICVIINAFLETLFPLLPVSKSMFYRILSVFISRNMSVYACIAAVIVMCSSLSLSLKSGAERILGTLLGGISGIIFLLIKTKLIPFDTLILPLGVTLLIYFLTVIDKSELITVTLTVFLITMISSDKEAHIYVIAKVLATVLGTAVSLSVNRLIKPKGEKHYEKES